MAATNSKHTQELKSEVVELLIAGDDPKQVSEDYGLDQDTLFHWLLWYVQAYYNPFDQDFGFDDEFLQHNAEMRVEAAIASSSRAGHSLGGKIGPLRKQAKAEKNYWMFICDEFKGDYSGALDDRELPVRLQLRGWETLPEDCQRELEWIKNFVKRLRLYKNIIDEEFENCPELEEQELAKRVQTREEDISKSLRRDLSWVKAYVSALRR